MTRLERMAQSAGIKYANPRTSEIEVLGEEAFDKLAKVVEAKGGEWHGYRMGCYDDEARDYWWMFQLGKHPNPAHRDLVMDNMD